MSATDAFKAATIAFKAKSGYSSKDIQDLEMVTLSGLQVAIAKIQGEQKNNRTLAHLGRLKVFLDAMEQYGKVIDVFVNTSTMLAYVWGPMKFLLLCSSNFSEAFTAILDGYDQIGKSLPVFIEYQSFLQSHPLLREALVSIFEDILDFHAEAVRYFRKKFWKTVFQATWNGLREKIQQISNNLMKHKQLFSFILQLTQSKSLTDQSQQLQSLQITQSKEFADQSQRLQHLQLLVEEKFRELQAFRMQAQDELNSRQRRDKFMRRREIHKWLNAVDNGTRHADILKKSHPGTGEWLLKISQFKQWYEPNHCLDALLWISGKPGAGKTVLTSFVIEKLKSLPNTMIAFHYCKQIEESRPGLLLIAKAIISQILDSNDDLILYFLEQAEDLLEFALKASKPTYVVIDGLDEYPRDDRKEITEWFRNVVESLPRNELGSLRCLFVSQEDGYAKKDFSEIEHIKISASDNTEDIRLYCRFEEQRIEEKFGSLEGFNCDLANDITKEAAGMFLYARLVLWNLYQQPTKADLKREIVAKKLPRGIEQAYTRIMERLLTSSGEPVPHSRKIYIFRLLGWLACARRSLRWYEIQAAMSVDTDDGIFDIQRRFVEDSKDLCASLVETSSDGSVTLVHSTTREFLIKNNYVQLPSVNMELAKICLIYLSLPDFAKETSTFDLRKSVIKGTYALLDYAIKFWGTHVEAGVSQVQQTSDNEESGLELLIECFEMFLNTYWTERTVSSKVPVSNTLQKRFHALSQWERFDDALICISALKRATRPRGDMSALCETLSIYQRLDDLRNSIEVIISDVSLPSETQRAIEDHYGLGSFKCPRLNCEYFHKGFPLEQERHKHLDQHDRKHFCTVEGCLMFNIGFVTLKDRNKHMLEIHGIGRAANHDTSAADVEFPSDNNVGEKRKNINGDINPADAEFPLDDTAGKRRKGNDQGTDAGGIGYAPNDMPSDFPQDADQEQFVGEAPSDRQNDHSDDSEDDALDEQPKQQFPKVFQCEVCQKTFKRGTGLKSHSLTHSSERPHVCPHRCGMAFARRPDLYRHVRRHDGEKNYVCGGTLQSGLPWGCGKGFARPDGLQEHHRSKIGQECIRPLLYEQDLQLTTAGI